MSLPLGSAYGGKSDAYPGGKYFHWGFRAQQEGYHPEIRVWVQKLIYLEELGDYTTPGGAAGVLTELKDWTTLQINRSRNSEGSMTLTLPNPRDKYVRVQQPRRKFYGTDADASTGDTIVQYYQNLTRDFLNRNSPLNLDKRGGDYTKRMSDYFHKKWIYGVASSSSNEAARAIFRSRETENGLARMQRIFVDIKGEDDRWYAGFSGIISRIDENFDVQGEPTLVLSCRDMLRIFSISEIVMQSPLWRLKIPNWIQISEQNRLSVQSNLMAKKSVSAIMFEVCKILQDSYCYPAVQARWGATNPGQPASAAANVEAGSSPTKGSLGAQEYEAMTKFVSDPNNFWFKHNFWDLREGIDPETLPPYWGFPPLRRRFVEVAGPPAPGGVAPKGSNWIVAENGIQADWTLDDLRAQLCVDGYFREAEQTTGYQFAISQTFEILEALMIRADAVCKHAAETMWCDWYADGNGNIVFQMTKMNNLPASIRCEDRRVSSGAGIGGGVSGQSVGGGTRGLEGLPTTERILGKKPVSMEFLPETFEAEKQVYDFSPGPDLMPTKGHSYNYILVDESVKGWSIGESEDSIVTHVTVPFGGDYEIGAGSVVDPIRNMGLAENDAWQTRFGIRSMSSSKIFTHKIFMGLSYEKRQQVMNAIAQHLMNMMNGGSVSGSVRLINRPDLDVGRTVLLFERQKIGYIDGISWQVNKGQPVSVSVVLSYVHDIADQIPNPWVNVRETVE